MPSAGGFCVIQAMVMSFISRPNTALGSIKPSCSLASYTDAFWPEAAFAVWRNLRLDSSAFCKIILPATLIRTAGPTRGNPWYATRRLAARAASNVRDSTPMLPDKKRFAKISHEETYGSPPLRQGLCIS